VRPWACSRRRRPRPPTADRAASLEQEREGLLTRLGAIDTEEENANLPVLGDAELVVPLAMCFVDGEVRGQVEHQHTDPVDAEQTRPRVEQILEGSKQAFLRRARRYGLRVENPN